MKLNFTLLFPVLIIITIAGCKQKENAGGEHTKIDTSSAIAGTSIKDTLDPDSLVPVDVAKTYVANYASHAGYVTPTKAELEDAKRNNRKPVLKPDTRCIWFSKARLTAMLNQLDKEKGTGVRFYLATYDKSYDTVATAKKPSNPPSYYWGYNTLLMVSTKDVNVGTTSRPIWIHKDYYKDLYPGLKTSGSTSGFIVGMVPENRGEICPPPKECYEIGATLIPEN